LKMKFNAGVLTGNVNGAGVFTNGTAAKNAVIKMVSGAAGAPTVTMTATGVNSDVVSGVGPYAGLVLTLADPGNLTGNDRFSVVENAALQYHVGANASQSIALRINSASSQSLGVGSLSVLTQLDAETSITRLDQAIQLVSAARANMGALTNRLTNALNTDQTSQANALTAHSNLTDVNVASTAVQFTRDQILLQAGTSVLAQANQSSGPLLGLLR
jgi:flagellin